MSHGQPPYVGGKFVVPFVMGRDDLTGESLWDKKQFSETRGHYWLWKNGVFEANEFVAINQYRRCFWFPQLIPAGHRFAEISDFFRANAAQPTLIASRQDYLDYINLIDQADLSTLNEWLQGVDLVVNRDLHFGYPLSRLYGHNHRAADWEVLAPILRAHGYDDGHYEWLTTHTVYIFSPALFATYMQDWWQVMSEVDALIPVEEHNYQHRKIGFMSEWFMTGWLLKHGERLHVERLAMLEGQLK